MRNESLTLATFPRAIMHIDADAFFASCEQSTNPILKGKPVVTGKERGIAASMSYEAKAMGVTRGMSLGDIRKICPGVVILASDYETYSLLSKRLFEIVRRYTPDVEEYSIDECFADLTGLRRPLRMSYPAIAQIVQITLEKELGITFSVGLGPSKVIAKIASKWKKPCGLTVIPGREIHEYLRDLPVEKIWGVGPQTTAYLQKEGVRTALQFARKPKEWVQAKLTKPHYEIWQELRGESVLPVETAPKEVYQSISKMKTFRPSSSDRTFVFAQLCRNIENACIKARRYKLAAQTVLIFLRTHEFRHTGFEIDLSRPSAFPNEIIDAIHKPFDAIFKEGVVYRATGVVLEKLHEDVAPQLDLFRAYLRVDRMRRLFESVDQLDARFGKHTVYVGSSFEASQYHDSLPDKGVAPRRTTTLLQGENDRQRLGIPLMGEVG